jgi:signal transduction histidine kinase
MLRNLLNNALRYTQRGGILLGCRRSDGRLTLVVLDSGDRHSAGETATGL